MTTHCWGENPRGKWVLEIETRTEQPSGELIYEVVDVVTCKCCCS